MWIRPTPCMFLIAWWERLQVGTKFIYDNDVLVGSYNVWQEKVVALSFPGCSARLKCPKCTSNTVELPCYVIIQAKVTSKCAKNRQYLKKRISKTMLCRLGHSGSEHFFILKLFPASEFSAQGLWISRSATQCTICGLGHSRSVTCLQL